MFTRFRAAALIVGLTAGLLAVPAPASAVGTASITGTITGDTGAPLSGVTVKLSSTTQRNLVEEVTDSAGNFTFLAVAAGSYTYQVPGFSPYVPAYLGGAAIYENATWIALAAGETRTGVDLALQRGVTISGTVTTADSTTGYLANAVVMLLTPTGSYAGFSIGDRSVGEFRFVDIPAGEYTLAAGPSWPDYYRYAPKWWGGADRLEDAELFTLEPGDELNDLVITLPLTTSISGRVTTTTAQGAGAPVAGATVTSGTRSVTTDAQGHYTLTGLAETDTATAWAAATGYGTEWWSNKTSPSSAQPLGLTLNEQRTGVDFTVEPEGRICGTITNPGSPPISLPLTEIVAQSTTGLRTNVILYGNNHDYCLSALPEADYIVWTQPYQDLPWDYPDTRIAPTWWPQSNAAEGAQTFHVGVGETATRDIATLAAPAPFADVTEVASPFWVGVNWMKTDGLSTGTPQAEGLPLFKPLEPVSRQAMAAFLHRMTQPHFTAPTTPTFADVDASSSFYTAIEWMASAGISTGTPQQTGKPLFKPADPILRQSLAIFLARYAFINTSTAPTQQSFVDVPVDSVPAAAIAWMKQVGLSTGTAQPTGLPAFKPNDPVSRQAVAAFLYRFYLARFPALRGGPVRPSE